MNPTKYFISMLSLLLSMSADVCAGELPEPGFYGLGRVVDAEEIKSWDIDVRPDGTGLPPGRGTVQAGERLYVAQCAHCHGAKGVDGPFDQLVGRVEGDAFPFALDPSIKKTIGNYWPYATTLFDYTRRAMPFDRPGSLSDDETYSLVAYLLYLNDIVVPNTELNQNNLSDIKMPARDRFVRDDRRGGPEVR